MTRDQCRHCASLVEDEAGRWVCDESGEPVEQVKECPYGMEWLKGKSSYAEVTNDTR